MFGDPDVRSSVAGLGNVYSGVPLAVEETNGPSMSIIKGELIALFPVITKAVWFTGHHTVWSGCSYSRLRLS